MKKTLATIFVGALAVGGAVLLDSKEVIETPPEATIAQKLAQEEQQFAHVDPNTNVTDYVAVITKETLSANGGWYVVIDGTPVFKPESEWVQTSTKGTIRKNGASVGYKYDKTLDAFIPPKPNASAVLDMQKAQWIQPAKVTKATST